MKFQLRNVSFYKLGAENIVTCLFNIPGMKILIFGISGRTGSFAAEIALSRGHTVVGIARNPVKAGVKGAEIVQGSPYEFETVKKAIKGCDAVISMLSLFPNTQGMFAKITNPTDTMSVSIKNAVKAMNEEGINRIVIMTALGVGDTSHEIPLFFKILMRISNIRYAYADHDRQEKELENSGLDWTVVRPVMLTEDNENLEVIHKIKSNGKIKSAISRKAVANFMIDCLEKDLFIKDKPGISNK